jgi:DNA-binding protein YbaB
MSTIALIMAGNCTRRDTLRTVQTPDEWLADFEAKVAEIQQKSAQFKENVERAANTQRSPDGAVAVSVAPNGALLDLRLDEDAMQRSAAELASTIMELVRLAQHTAQAGVATAFVPLGGARLPEEPLDEPVTPPRPLRRVPEDDEDEMDLNLYDRPED